MNARLKTTENDFSFRVPSRSFAANAVALEKGELHSWTGNHTGLVIHAREGAVWLTQKGDARDIILSRGQCFRVTRPGRVVAECLTPIARLMSERRT